MLQFVQCLSFKYGNICVFASTRVIEKISILHNKFLEEKPNNLTKQCIAQIQEYLMRKRQTFDCNFHLIGTEFEKLVWLETLKIPYAKVITYKELAERIARPKAYRAVANALRKNRLPLLIPCHRVISSTGVGGYSAGLEIKKFFLYLEGMTF